MLIEKPIVKALKKVRADKVNSDKEVTYVISDFYGVPLGPLFLFKIKNARFYMKTPNVSEIYRF